MATEFIMPKLGLTMEEGTITEWYADDGATVAAGAAVLRIETDKTETDVEAAGSGRLHRLGAGRRDVRLRRADRLVPRRRRGCAADRVGGRAGHGHDRGDAPRRQPTPSPPTGRRPSPRTGARIIASPLAKRLAAERNIDLRSIARDGPRRPHRVRGPRRRRCTAPAPRRTAHALAATRRRGRAWASPPPRPAANLADLLGIDLALVAPDPIEQRVTRESVALHVRQILNRAGGHRAGTGTTAAVASPSPAALPACAAGADADGPPQRDARHDRPPDARVADADGAADAVHGRRSRRGRRRPRPTQGRRCATELHRLRDRRRGPGARSTTRSSTPRSPPTASPCSRGCTSAWRSRSTTG